MTLQTAIAPSHEIDPIDIAEAIIEARSWDFDRVGDDQIAMVVEGQWHTYSITIAWSHHDKTLRLICTFEFDPPEARLAELHAAIGGANEHCWTGNFVLWPEQKFMVYRYGLTLAGDAIVTPAQIDAMLRAALGACERFYPAFQLVGWGEESAENALRVAMEEAYGRA